MRKGILFFVVFLFFLQASWTLPLNMRNVQDCKQMIENFISDRNTGYQMTVVSISGGGMTNDPNEIHFEIDNDGRLDINIQYSQRMYFQIFRIIIEKQNERRSNSNFISFMGMNNGSSQDIRLFLKEDKILW